MELFGELEEKLEMDKGNFYISAKFKIFFLTSSQQHYIVVATIDIYQNSLHRRHDNERFVAEAF